MLDTDDMFEESGLLERGDDVVNCKREGHYYRYRIVKRAGVIVGRVVYPGEYVVMYNGEYMVFTEAEFKKHFEIIEPR